MKYTRLFTGDDGQSHFEDAILEANTIPTTSVTFGDATDVQEIPWHHPPTPQFVIMLQGAMEIEVGDGTKRIFNPGDILLAADTTGQGHITRAASHGTRTYIVIPLSF